MNRSDGVDRFTVAWSLKFGHLKVTITYQTLQSKHTLTIAVRRSTSRQNNQESEQSPTKANSLSTGAIAHMSSKDAAPEGQNAAAVDHSAAAGHQSAFDANSDNNTSIDDEIERAGNLK